MRTTLDIDEKLMERLVKATGEKSKSKAVAKAIEGYLRRKAIEELIAMAGKIDIEDVSEKQREADLRRQKFLDELWGRTDDNC